MICEQCKMDHDRVRKACTESLYRFARICCGYNKGPEHPREPSPDFHGKICHWYQGRLAAGKRFIFIAVHRKALKSSLFSVAKPMWLLARNPNERILIVSETSNLAEAWVGQMKSLIQRDRPDMFGFKHYFPELVPDPKQTKWGADAFTINRTGDYQAPSVEAVGLRASVTGKAATHVILDDLVGKVVASSPELLQAAKEMLRESRRCFADPNTGTHDVIGTLWPGGFYEDLIKDRNYEKLILGCYRDSRWKEHFGGDDPPDTPCWKEGFTKETLRMQRDLDGEYEFAHQWLNTFIEEGMRRFEEKDLRYYATDARHERLAFGPENADSVARSELLTRMVVDPSTGEATDDTAITICGWHRTRNRAFVLDAWSGRVLPNALIDQIFTLYEKWKPQSISIEEQGFQKMLKYMLRNEALRRGVALPLRTDARPESRRKVSRIIDGLQPFVANNQVYFLRSQGKLIRQLLDYDPARDDQADDLVDTLAYHCEGWTYSPTREVSDEIPVSEGAQEEEAGDRWYGLEVMS